LEPPGLRAQAQHRLDPLLLLPTPRLPGWTHPRRDPLRHPPAPTAGDPTPSRKTTRPTARNPIRLRLPRSRAQRLPCTRRQGRLNPDVACVGHGATFVLSAHNESATPNRSRNRPLHATPRPPHPGQASVCTLTGLKPSALSNATSRRP